MFIQNFIYQINIWETFMGNKPHKFSSSNVDNLPLGPIASNIATATYQTTKNSGKLLSILGTSVIQKRSKNISEKKKFLLDMKWFHLL